MPIIGSLGSGSAGGFGQRAAGSICPLSEGTEIHRQELAYPH